MCCKSNRKAQHFHSTAQHNQSKGSARTQIRSKTLFISFVILRNYARGAAQAKVKSNFHFSDLYLLPFYLYGFAFIASLIRDRFAFLIGVLKQRWRSRRTTRLTTSRTRLTGTGSRSPGSTVTLPPKGYVLCGTMDPKFLRNQRYARKHNKKSGEAATEEQ
ncbi:hypothetical protein RHMOL_Rhmol02G0005000 [Rhododendron molle]|uniref:Uncharacterized protein n=1 Tax=Rhododendron molle TaxID=49168 RepID=A0ACC0PMG8_RHOML|nr:hypothetical protein RHMOL_Rhmol02G0005000 [Rhododendron molle]